MAGVCRAWASIGALLLLVLGGLPAHADGPGVRSNRFVFHPEFELGGSYDSNFFRDADLELTAPADPVWVITAAGRIKLANRNPSRLGISLDVGASYRELFAADELDPAEAIGGADHRAAQFEARSGFDGVDGELDLIFGPRSTFALGLEVKGRYTDEPANELILRSGYRRLDVESGPDLRFRPGEDAGSRALEMTLGYRFAMLRFLDLDAELGTAPAQKDTHKVRLNTRWNFYPKTAALFDVQFWIVNQQGGVVETGSASSALLDKDQTPFRLSAGLKGLLTPRLSATVKLGFANSFNNVGESYQGLIADTALEYVLEPRLHLRLTWRRKLDDDAFANYFVMDRFALAGELALPGRLQLEARAGVDLTDYSDVGRPVFAVVDRQETTVLGEVALGWHPLDWLGLRASWKVEDNQSDFCYRLDLTANPCPVAPDAEEALQIDRAEYTRHRLSFILRLSY